METMSGAFIEMTAGLILEIPALLLQISDRRNVAWHCNRVSILIHDQGGIEIPILRRGLIVIVKSPRARALLALIKIQHRAVIGKPLTGPVFQVANKILPASAVNRAAGPRGNIPGYQR